MKKLFSVLLAGVLVAASALTASAGYYVYDSSDDEYWDAALNMLDKEGTVYWWNEEGAASDYGVAMNTETSTEMDGTDIESNLQSGWYEIVLCGLGSTADEFPEAVEGKVALAVRGSSTFTDKSANAADAGAIACIVGNNGQGELEALDENGNNTTGTYNIGNMSVDYETLPMCLVQSDFAVRLVATCANISVAEAVEVFNNVYGGATELGLEHVQSAYAFLGTYEEYIANATRTEENTIGAVVTTATTEEVAEEATTEEVAEEATTEEVATVEETETVETTETVVEEATTETVETEATVEEAPQTFDFGVIAAVAAAVSAAGYAISKKR